MWLLLACNGGDIVASDKFVKDSEEPVETAQDTSDSVDSADSDSDPVVDTDPEFAGPPRVVLFIGDGMGFQHVAGGGLYANGAQGSLRMESMEVQGRLLTASLTGLTDSAASGTAMSTGTKTFNGTLGMDRDENELQNLLELAASMGMSTGVVTTDNLWGATPASFLVHLPNRYDGAGISEELVTALPSVLLGGGAGLLEAPLQAVDHQRVSTRDELLALAPDGRPVVGLFDENTFPYVADGYLETLPSLAEMTGAALDVLDDDEDGFFLIVEGARIDHASHARMEDKVLQEVAALDEAVGVALDWAAERDEATIVVTADHECGGLSLTGQEVDGLPGVSFRRGDHTNEDVPVYARGPRTAPLQGERLDNTWVHAVLSAALTDTPVQHPHPGSIVDGSLADLGDRVTAQPHISDYGQGHNQLDALRITSDGEGLRIGIDGVFEDRNNVPLVLIDLDFGEGTGLGRDAPLEDHDGELDSVLSTISLDMSAIPGVGFDVAIGGLNAEELRSTDLRSGWGARGLSGDWKEPGNLFWLHAILNWDDGNVARNHVKARDAKDPGQTENGWEVLLLWQDLWGGPRASEIAVVALLVNRFGDHSSNQTLPPQANGVPIGNNPIPIPQVVRMSVDGEGAASVVQLWPQ